MPTPTAAWACHPALLTFFILLLSAAVAGAAGFEPPAFKPDQMGGTLYANFNAEPQTLNPLTSRDYYAQMLQERVLEGLIDYDLDSLELVGVLADRWEVSPDGKVITFHINPKARFSDGSPVTADDVLFTYETMRNPEIDAADMASYFEDCEKCEKIDNLTVRYTWKKTYFKSLEVSGGMLPIIPKHVYQFTEPKKFNDLRDVVVGSGPYMMKPGDWKTGEHIVLTRNPNYWRNPVAIERVVYRFIKEEQASVQALKAGQLDEVPVTPEWWVRLGAEPGFKDRFQMLRYSQPRNGYVFIGWNNARWQFKDARTRRALTQLIWREQLVKYMLYDIAQVTSGPFWNKSPQHDRTVEPWPFDREAARRLLKEAGWEDRDRDGWLENAEGKRFEFDMSIPLGNQQGRDLMRVIGEEFRRMGIKMNIAPIDWPVFTVRLDNRDFDAVIMAWATTLDADPYQIWHSSQIVGRGSNFIGYRNAEADRLIEQARLTLDTGKRNAIFHQFHRLLHEEQPYTFMWGRESLRIVTNRVKGVKIHRLGLDWREWWIGKDDGAAKDSSLAAGGAS